jgi:hypothetical protein
MRYVASNVMIVSKWRIVEGVRRKRSKSDRFTVLAYLPVGTKEKCEKCQSV